MTVPLSQLSFREPELGLWWCKKEAYFDREGGGIYTCKVGEPIVITRIAFKGDRRAWMLVFKDGSIGWVEWDYNTNGRWSKRFEPAK